MVRRRFFGGEGSGGWDGEWLGVGVGVGLVVGWMVGGGVAEMWVDVDGGKRGNEEGED